MEQPDHDIEAQMADTGPDESGNDQARLLSDEGEPARGSLATEAAAGTVGGVVAGSLVGWGTAGIAAAGAAVALPLAGAVAAGGLIAVGGVTVARRLGVPVDQAAHGAGRAAVTAARAVAPAATTAAKVSKSAATGAARAVGPAATTAVKVSKSAATGAARAVGPAATTAVKVSKSAATGAARAVGPAATTTPNPRHRQGLQIRGHRRGAAPEVARGQDRVALTLSAAAPAFERVKAAADADDRSVSSWIRRAVGCTLRAEQSGTALISRSRPGRARPSRLGASAGRCRNGGRSWASRGTRPGTRAARTPPRR